MKWRQQKKESLFLGIFLLFSSLRGRSQICQDVGSDLKEKQVYCGVKYDGLPTTSSFNCNPNMQSTSGEKGIKSCHGSRNLSPRIISPVVMSRLLLKQLPQFPKRFSTRSEFCYPDEWRYIHGKRWICKCTHSILLDL